jgi:basic membrane protein A and related proteins
MRPRALLGLSLAAVLLAFVPARDAARRRPSANANAKRVGLVFDVGGRGDKSFNDAAYAGLLQASQEYPVDFELAEPAGAEDREAALRLLAARKFDLVIGVGHIFSRDMSEVATEFPDVRFACVDFAPGTKLPPNLTGLGFREEEGAFLVGAAAALTSKTKQVGFVGGMSISLIRKFEAGYRRGVAEVCPSCVVHVAYAGTSPDAFRDPAKGKALAASQIASGADVLFHAAGATGHGVFEAAHEASVWAIGVDRDQYDELPSVVLTSLVKRVDTAVATVIGRTFEGEFPGGKLEVLGLREHGVSWVHEGPHAEHLSAETIRQVEALRVRIEAGTIVVPTVPPGP